jgi:hypothetical protein
MANLRHMAIVVAHHTNQRADVTDIYELVSGTSELISVVDSLMVPQRRRSDDVGLRHITAARWRTRPLRSALPMVGGDLHPKACPPTY